MELRSVNMNPDRIVRPYDDPAPPGEPGDEDDIEQVLPPLTPLQFLVLWLLLAGPKSGRTLRTELDAWGAEMGRSAFSQLMIRLADAGLVRRDLVSVDAPGRAIHSCVYRARIKGLDTWRACRGFYVHLDEPADAEAHLFDETTERDEDDELVDRFIDYLMVHSRARLGRDSHLRRRRR
jgi:hypothetical protein